MLRNYDFKGFNNPYKEKSRSKLGLELAALCRRMEKTDRAMLVLIDGWGCSGKGAVLSDVVRELDPRFFEVSMFDEPEGKEKNAPVLARYMNLSPLNGHMMFFNRAHYYELMAEKRPSKVDFNNYVEDVAYFERLMQADGTLVMKFFMHIPKELMEKRVRKSAEVVAHLPGSQHLTLPRQAADEEELAHYEDRQNIFEEVLNATDFGDVPWHVVPTVNKKEAARFILGTLIKELTAHLDFVPAKETALAPIKKRPLSEVDMTATISKDDYDKRLKELQEEARKLMLACYVSNLPVMCVFEGTDASGKGGCIRRLLRTLDPRGYDVSTTAAPTPEELNHHYLWRFYRNMPTKGRLTVFDRSWYGRVLVERVEGFAKPVRWQAAYQEICEMEKSLLRSDVCFMKFLLVISKKEQKARFEARQNDPLKSYKLTDEDWRNHEKYDIYTEAMDDMVGRTNEAVRWNVISSEDKRHARIKVLEIFCKELSRHLAMHGCDDCMKYEE